MNHNRCLLLSCGAALAALSLACAKQTVEDDKANASSMGGKASIFAGGTSSGTASASGTGAGAATSFGSTSGKYPPASQTENGTFPVDANMVEEVLADPVKACQGAAVEAEAEPATLLFLVDVSGSMRVPSPTTNGATKWELTRTALKNAIQDLPYTFGVGVSFYPNMGIVANTVSARPTSACVDSSRDVPLAEASDGQKANIMATLDGMEPAATGATPTHDGLNLAIQQLANTTLTGRRYIVLITDGQPTQRQGCIGTGIMCTPEDTAPIVNSIAQAYVDSEIKTFVVGSPGSEKNECTGADVRGWLAQAARAGETAAPVNCSEAAPPFCHFDLSQAADFGTALTEALKSITRSLLSCNYGVPQATSGTRLDPALVNMFFSDGSGAYWLLLPDDIGSCNKGWSYTDASKNAVQICGETCKLLQESPNATLNILFGCEPGSLPIF